MIEPETDFAGTLLPDEPLLPGAAFHELLADLRARYRLAPTRFMGIDMPLITRFADLDAAFRDDEGFPAGPTYEHSIEPCQGVTFESRDGPEHHVLRDLSTRSLRARPVARYAAARIPDLAHQAIDRFVERGSADLVADFTSVFPFLVFADRLGLPLEGHERFMPWAFDILGYAGDHATGLAAAAELTAFVEPILAERRGDPADDLLSSMVTATKDDRRLDDEEILSTVRALFAAGAATSHHGLGNTLYALLTHPQVVDRLRDDPTAIPRAVEEMLRWEPPIGVLPRLVPFDVELAGQTVAAGSMVLMGIASANRDDAMYPDPHRFDIDRPPGRLLTFGFGSHYCPGSHLARAQIAMGVQALLERLPDLRLVDVEASRPCGTVMRGPRSLPVEF
ncbi:MAG: cytochrome P450 [Acidimicrobiia bacterium]|nr:cytochrome P450 [Acidimicrobiia bacterium]